MFNREARCAGDLLVQEILKLDTSMALRGISPTNTICEYVEMELQRLRHLSGPPKRDESELSETRGE